MKLTVQSLREKVDAALERHEAAARAEHDEKVAQHKKAVDAYRASGAPQQLLANLRGLVERARKGGLLGHYEIAEAVGEHSFRDRLTYRGPGAPKPFEHQPPRDLTALRDFLDTVADDEVSTSALRDLGFRNIAGLLR